MAFAERTLGPKAVEYIRECLGYANTLGECLLARADLATGKVTTYLPADVTDEEAHNFTWGGKLPRGRQQIVGGARIEEVDAKETTAHLVSVIRSFMATRENAVCILSDSMSKPSDPCLAKAKAKWVCYRDEVYVVVAGGSATEEEVDQAFGEAGSGWWSSLVGALTSHPQQGAFQKQREITAEDLKLLAERAETIVVGAYDMEGFVIWHKP
jgi:hypothetical protein